jgi:hypothetical protein
MAADLVKDPDAHQDTPHDLESFFWVLMWVVVKCVQTSWDQPSRSSFIYDTMSPRVYGHIGSETTGASGGFAKMNFLQNPFSMDTLEILQNPALLRLILKWRFTFAERHSPPILTTVERGPMEITITKVEEEVDGPETTVKVLKLNDELSMLDPYVVHGPPPWTADHGCILRQITLALENYEWPSIDKACPQSITRFVSELFAHDRSY